MGIDSLAVILFQAPEPLELAVTLSGLEAVDGDLLDDFSRTERVIEPPILRVLENHSEMVRARESVCFQLREAAIAPTCRNFVSRGLATVRMVATDSVRVHAQDLSGARFRIMAERCLQFTRIPGEADRWWASARKGGSERCSVSTGFPAHLRRERAGSGIAPTHNGTLPRTQAWYPESNWPEVAL